MGSVGHATKPVRGVARARASIPNDGKRTKSVNGHESTHRILVGAGKEKCRVGTGGTCSVPTLVPRSVGTHCVQEWEHGRVRRVRKSLGIIHAPRKTRTGQKRREDKGRGEGLAGPWKLPTLVQQLHGASRGGGRGCAGGGARASRDTAYSCTPPRPRSECSEGTCGICSMWGH